MVDLAAGVSRPMRVEDFHDMLSEVSINDTAPTTVRQEFDVARNVFLYSWFAYELATVAEHHAYGVLEMALRVRSGQPATSLKHDLKSLIDIAVAKNWFDQDDNRVELLKGVVRLRNDLSHGRPHLLPSGLFRCLSFAPT
jgi:hypothetical protein